MDEFLKKTDKNTYVLLDVRETDEYKSGHIPNAINLPLSTLTSSVSLSKETDYYVVCQLGGRSAMACESLSVQGYRVTNIAGGTSAFLGQLTK